MAKFKLREIAFISLPVLFIGGFGWWANARQAERVARANGPYRTRLVSVEDLEPTPFERWQGFDSKVRIVATDDGKPQLPANVKSTGLRALECKAFLVGNSAKGQLKLPISSHGVGSEVSNEKNPGALMSISNTFLSSKESENVQITFLANLDYFANAKATLQGKANVVGLSYGKSKASFSARSLPINHTLVNSDEKTDRTAPQFISAQVTHLSPREIGSSRMNDGNDTLVRAQFDCSKINREEILSSRFVDPYLEDENGKRVVLKQGSQVIPVYIGGIGALSSGIVKFDDRLPLYLVPFERGQITLKTWFSYKNSWPTPVAIVVRARRKPPQSPRKLRLQSVQLVGSNVEVSVRYTDTLSLETEQSTPQMTDAHSFDLRPEPRQSGTDRLLSNYSQHLEYAGGKKQWSGQYVGDARAECAPDNSCVITYPIPAMNNWKPGQTARFKAQIGIEDDGFLDVELPISKPK